MLDVDRLTNAEEDVIAAALRRYALDLGDPRSETARAMSVDEATWRAFEVGRLLEMMR